MQEVMLAIPVKTNASVTPEEIAKIVQRLINIGLADAAATIEDSGNSGEADVQAAELATDLHIGAPVVAKTPLVLVVGSGGIHGNDSMPDAFGGIWREYDKEGELFTETSAEALAASGVTDYCNQVCGGGNCGSGVICQYGIDHKTHMPPTNRNIFNEIMDAKSMSIEAADAYGNEDSVEVRRDLIAAELLSRYPADMVITREQYDADDDFGEAMIWLSPFFELPNWQGRTIGELLKAYPVGTDYELRNVLQYRTNSPNKDGVHAKNITLAELRNASPLPGNRWSLSDQATLQLVISDRMSI